MSDNYQKKNNLTSEPDSSGINLLPESLRLDERKELLSKDGQPKVEMRVPKLDKKKLPEGKVPWFSFVSWFRKDKKTSSEPAVSDGNTVSKPKLIFKILKSKEEQQAAEQAKEETWKQEIINNVFLKIGKDLPANDNALFNQERPIRPPVSPEPVMIPTTPMVVALVAIPPVPISDEAVDMSLPLAPIEPNTAPVVSPVTPPEPLPAIPLPSVPPQRKKGWWHLPQWHFGRHHHTVSAKKEGLEGFQVNLMPTALTVKKWSQIGQRLVLSAVLSLVVVGLGYGGLFIWELQIERRANAIDQAITQVEASIGSFQSLKDQIAVTETQIKDVQDLLNRHIYWTRFFVLLQKYSIDTVYYDKFAAGINGSLSLSAHGNDYQSAARQLKLLQTTEAQEFVKDAAITSVSLSATGGVNFSISLTLNTKLFNYATSTPTP